MGVTFKRFGDWAKAGAVLRALNVNLCPAFKAQLQEDGELIQETLVGHIDSQDLPWAPLSEKTIAIKGNSTIYVDTGYLKNSIKVRKVRAPANGLTLFIGASAWDKTKSGLKASDLMIWLEYGTSRMPPRPLIRPTWDEVEPIIRDNWQELLKDLIDKGGSYAK